MRIAVLCAANSWYLRDLQRAAGDKHKVEPLAFSQIQSSINTDTDIAVGTQSLTDYDVVLVRTMPPGSLEQVVFRMDALQRLAARGVSVINSPKAIEAAVDKYLTLSLLQNAGFEVPPTETSQSVDEAMDGFHRLGGDVVVKPLFGSEGRGIARIADEAIAVRTFKMLAQLGAVIYQQKFIDHEGYDIRLLVIRDEVLGMRRSNKLDWRTNVSRGATAEAIEVTDEMAAQAIRAARSVDASIAGVDFLPGKDGRCYAIEVNAVPGWRAMAKAQNVDAAQKVLNFCSCGF